MPRDDTLCARFDFSTDIYIAMVSSTHNVCAKDVYVAIVSTIVETDKPELEIAPGLNLLGPIHDKSVLAPRLPRLFHAHIMSQVCFYHPTVYTNILRRKRQHFHHPLV